MKTTLYIAVLKAILGSVAALGCVPVCAQGRVVINEYLPWPSNGCGTTAEFIELHNFGPGPVNIGCYVVTDGDYAITIPTNTILAPGAFFVLAGQNMIPQNCGNDARNVTVDLNWNTCGCTNAPIPVTGDGFMTDGGSATEQVVLLNAASQVADAVVRGLPVEPSAGITTHSMGSCTPFSFDLDTMSVQYETIGESTGRGNSMARRTDGACYWIKETQESAGDANGMVGGTELHASLSITQALTCTNTGSVVVSILSGDMSRIFPLTYVLAKDTDSNLLFTATDSYLFAADSTSATIPVGGLTPGQYKLQVAPGMGCDEAMFDFTILNCDQGLLPVTGTPGRQGRTAKELQVKTWPNPFIDHVTLSFYASQPGRDQVLITDAAGRTFYNMPVNYSRGDNRLLLSLPNLLPGTWYLRLPSAQSRPISLIKVKK